MFLALLAVLLTAKAFALAGRHLPVTAWAAIAFFWHDGAVALAFACAEAAMRFCRTTPAATANQPPAATRRTVYGLYAAAAAYVVVNVPVTRVLATPMTGPMWRAARGPLADSMRRHATLDMLLACGVTTAVALAAPFAARRLHRPARRLILAILVLASALGPLATSRLDTGGFERNAWTALIELVLPSAAAAPSNAYWTRRGFDRSREDDLTSLAGAAAGRHIIFVSLESAGAQYLGLYGAQPDVMPSLSRLAQHAIVFERAYAAYPESIKGLYSILCSAWPAAGSDVSSYGGRRCPSLAERLAQRGYRTALFHSGRFGYLGMEAVVRGRGYETLADAGDIGGHRQSSFGVDEASTVAAMLRWIESLPAGSRFFLTYLPIAGHHPYETPEPGPYEGVDDRSRYLNALRYADQSLELLMRGLDARGLTRNLLWIVAGDHGEAFGQHVGNYGHTFYIYEENVHVPLVIAAPGLIPAETRRKQVVSLIDIAPTVFDLAVRGETPAAGDRFAPALEGQTMSDGRSRMAFFAADYSRRMIGLRDGRFKAILTLDSGRMMLFDLDADPGEQTDIAADHAGRAVWYEHNLRNWAAAHQR